MIKKFRRPWRFYYRKAKNFIIYRILHVDDTPHRIALGVAVGMFVTWTPTPGLQMALIVTISTLLRANKVVGVPLAWLSNPATFWVYVFCYFIGCKVIGAEHNEAIFVAAMKEAFSGHGWIAGFRHFFHAMGDVFWPLLVGCLIFSAIVGALTYVATYYAVIAYRRARAARKLARSP
jgi:uncharacterized protein